MTLVNFGLFDLLGLKLSPRIRDLGKITLYRTGSRAQAEAAFPRTGPLLTRQLNTDLIAEQGSSAASSSWPHSTAPTAARAGLPSKAGRTPHLLRRVGRRRRMDRLRQQA